MVFHLHHIIDTPNVNDTGPFSSKKYQRPAEIGFSKTFGSGTLMFILVMWILFLLFDFLFFHDGKVISFIIHKIKNSAAGHAYNFSNCDAFIRKIFI